jgi:hypothetical protein
VGLWVALDGVVVVRDRIMGVPVMVLVVEEVVVGIIEVVGGTAGGSVR